MKSALILSSTGSPKKPEKKEIRKFLKNFLGDKRLIRMPKPILFFILIFRPYIIKKKYEKIFINGKNPLNYFTEKIKEKLQKQLNMRIEIGNLYAEPYLKDKVNELKRSDFKKIYLFPLYPQESPATTDILKFYFKDFIGEEIEGLIFPAYFSHPLYLKAMASKINEKKEKFDFLIFSYHNLPEKMEGSLKYKEDCYKTTQLILKEINFEEERAMTSFQSKFGFSKWLEPSTKDVLKDLSRKNFEKVGILSPSFPIDCLETLYDIKINFCSYYKKLSGKDLIYIEGLNSSQEHINFLKNFIGDNI